MTLNFKYEDAGEIRTLSVGVKETGIHVNRSDLGISGLPRTSLVLREWGDESYYCLENNTSSYAYTRLNSFSDTSFRNNLTAAIDWNDESCQIVARSGMHNFGRNESGSYYQTITFGDAGECSLQFFIWTDPQTQQSYAANGGFVSIKPHGSHGWIATSNSALNNLIDDSVHDVRPNIMLLKITMTDDDSTSPNYEKDYDIIVIVRYVYNIDSYYLSLMLADARLFNGAKRFEPSKSTAKGNTPNGFRGGRDDYSDIDTISTIADRIGYTANSALHGIHFYHLPSYSDYDEFCEAMWSNDTWAQFTSRGEWNPVGGVLSLALMPCYPDTYTNTITANIRSSGKELLLDNDPVSAITPPCSTAELLSLAIKPLEYSHSFLDWSGFTTAYCRLPFIGTVPIDVSKIMNGGIRIKYNIDFITGNCLAQIYTMPEQDVMGDRSNDTIWSSYDDQGITGCVVMIGQYSGNCAHKLPYSGASIGGTNVIGSIVTATLGAVAIGATLGGAAPVAAGAAGAVGAAGGLASASTIIGGVGAIAHGLTGFLNVPKTSPMVQNATPNADTMGMLVPALIIERPIDITPLDENGDATVFERFNGRPSASGGQVKDYKDFDTGEGVFIKGILHADTLYATEDEKRQIESAFAKGVYL